MTKKNMMLLAGIFLLYLGVNNPEGVHISSLERLATGYNDSTNSVQFYNYLLNLGTMAIFIAYIEQALAATFLLRHYIATRGGYHTLVGCLLKTALKHIAIILLIKQILYIVFYFSSKSFTSFYLFDMLSTFLTLSILALILIVMKLQGIREKISLFSVLSLTAIVQFSSYTYPILAAVVIASAGWQEQQVSLLVYKCAALVIMIGTVFFLSKPGRLMEVVEQ